MEVRKRFAGLRKVFLVAGCVLSLIGPVTPTLAQSQPPASPDKDADVPVAPILPAEFQGWTNALRMANTNLELVIAPALGRIVSLRYRNGENILRFDEAFAGHTPEKKESRWVNAGGEWLWPVAQSTWPEISGSDWPPPEVLGDALWKATAWIAADGSLNCTVTRHYGGPLYVKVTRLIRLDPQAPAFSIRQRIERTRSSTVPVSLWNIFQVSNAQWIFIPADKTSPWENGFRALMFGEPPRRQWRRCGDVVAYRATKGEYKLCSDSERGWIAACRDDVTILVRARNESSPGAFPDGGCVVEMYSNAGLGYSEIETLSPEVVLDDGSSLQNEVFVQCEPTPAHTNECAVADMLRERLAETSPRDTVEPGDAQAAPEPSSTNSPRVQPKGPQ